MKYWSKRIVRLYPYSVSLEIVHQLPDSHHKSQDELFQCNTALTARYDTTRYKMSESPGDGVAKSGKLGNDLQINRVHMRTVRECKFLLKFTGKEDEINLLGDGTEKPEFGEWSWMSPEQVVDLVDNGLQEVCLRESYGSLFPLSSIKLADHLSEGYVWIARIEEKECESHHQQLHY
ncbi:hypothetical protein HYC85_014052 [Camellia sinensis]|uniref:Nudix hydrolase domain-containing protein n=1 Tax=Camellia sinensis TaxID=4442 RepID=A0A7J7H6F9_CAMSI|nr:hypothetical protein HYC85_014052 [Camellia sinensis]